MVTPPTSSPPFSNSESASWSRRISKADIYPSSLDAIAARIDALRALWATDGAARVVPVARALCSPLFLRLEAEETLAGSLLGPRAAYAPPRAPLADRDAAHCVLAVARLLPRLHASGVVHGHLHADVVWADTTAAAADLHRVVVAECELPISALVPQGQAGHAARRCAAPEVLRGEPYTAAADVWGLAVLLVQLLLGPSKAICTVDLEDSDLLSPFISVLSPGAASLVLPCLKSDPQARPLLWGVLRHPFLAAAERDVQSAAASDADGGGGGDEGSSSSVSASPSDADEESESEEGDSDSV